MHTWTPASDLSSVSGHFGTALYVSNVAVENPGSHKGVAIIQSKRGVIFRKKCCLWVLQSLFFYAEHHKPNSIHAPLYRHGVRNLSGGTISMARYHQGSEENALYGWSDPLSHLWSVWYLKGLWLGNSFNTVSVQIMNGLQRGWRRTQLHLSRTPQETHLPIDKTPENYSPLSPKCPKHKIDVLTAAAWQFSVFEDQSNPPLQPCPQRSSPTTLKDRWQNGLTLQIFQLQLPEQFGSNLRFLSQLHPRLNSISLQPSWEQAALPSPPRSTQQFSQFNSTQGFKSVLLYNFTIISHIPAKHRVGVQINGNLWNVFFFYHICPPHFLLFNSLWHLQAYFWSIQVPRLLLVT